MLYAIAYNIYIDPKTKHLYAYTVSAVLYKIILIL